MGDPFDVTDPNTGITALTVDKLGNLTTTGNVAIKGSGTLTAPSQTVSGNQTVTGNETVTGTLAVTGATSANGGLAVSGGTGLTGSKAWLYQYLEPASSLGSTVDGRLSASSTSATMTTGTIYACAIPLESGITVTNLSVFVTTAEATGTHAWIGLADNALKVLAVSADNTGAAYFGGANTAVTTAMATPVALTRTGLYYVFVCTVASGTMPVFAAAPALTHANLSNVAPIVCGSSGTSQTTPPAVASTLTALTATAGHQFYAWVT